MLSAMTPFEELLNEMTAFFAVREWTQFHSPKNVAINLAVEAAEVLEHFSWITEKESAQLSPETLTQVREEIGDVMISLLHLASKLGINPLDAAREKMIKIGQRYPIEQCKGKNLKYTAYENSQGN